MNTQILELAEKIEQVFEKEHEWGAEYETFECDTETYAADVVYEAEYKDEMGCHPLDVVCTLVSSKLYVSAVWYGAGHTNYGKEVVNQEQLITCLNTLIN